MRVRPFRSIPRILGCALGFHAPAELRDVAVCWGDMCVQLADEVTLDQRIHSRHSRPEWPRSYQMRAAHCPGCNLFLGESLSTDNRAVLCSRCCIPLLTPSLLPRAGVHVVSFSEPQGPARLGGGRSHGREVDVGNTDDEWLAYQHALQATYQQLTTHLRAQAAEVLEEEEDADEAAVQQRHGSEMDDAEQGEEDAEDAEDQEGGDAEVCAAEEEASDPEQEQEQQQQQEEQQEQGEDEHADEEDGDDDEGEDDEPELSLPAGMCADGGTIVNQLFLGKSYLRLMKVRKRLVWRHFMLNNRPFAKTGSGQT
eukprot:COSAG06_NODE_788_length_12290_cov_34.300386_8_plen_311_part_00